MEIKTKEVLNMYDEQYRPQFHYSPNENWMNDPNGLVYYKGEYHLFYQYHPHSKIWVPMHWGHAVSKDLLHWEELPIALYPDELGQIFSGSAVIDKQNTSGLKTADEDVMVAIFTHHGEDNEKQSIAYSNDRGRTWTKYKGNPVISNPGLKDFRDPKVFWHVESQKWVMSLACGDRIHFYGSPYLIDWDLLSTLVMNMVLMVVFGSVQT
jgi:fructan beta-fructosidase